MSLVSGTEGHFKHKRLERVTDWSPEMTVQYAKCGLLLLIQSHYISKSLSFSRYWSKTMTLHTLPTSYGTHTNFNPKF